MEGPEARRAGTPNGVGRRLNGFWEKYDLSERHAGRLLERPRGTQCYTATVRADEDALTRAIVTLASEYGRYGYRRIAKLLKDAGWNVGMDRVQRIWRCEGLRVPKKHKPRRCLWLNDGSCIRLRPERYNHVWNYDFVEAQTHTALFFGIPASSTPGIRSVHARARSGHADAIDSLSRWYKKSAKPNAICAYRAGPSQIESSL